MRGGVTSDGLSVVSGASGDDSTGFVTVCKGEDFVESAALLEGSRALKIVELEKDLLGSHLRQLVGMRCGREVDFVLNALSGLLDSV